MATDRLKIHVMIDDFEVDVALTETHSFENDVTEYPVEDGADITDHVRAMPVRLVIEGVVSDTPIGDLALRRAESTSLPSDECLSKLIAIRDAREPITIQTALKTYDNMVMQALDIPVSLETGDSLRFTATFQQVTLVTNDRTSVRVALPRGKKVNRGNKFATLKDLEETDAKIAALKPGDAGVELDQNEVSARAARYRASHPERF